MATDRDSSKDGLPGKVTAELSAHQGPVRAVRFNSELVKYFAYCEGKRYHPALYGPGR